MFLGLSAAAFAQATYSVGSIPVTAVVQTGLTERTGDITFTQVAGTTQAGTITISYGVPITIPFSAVTITVPVGAAAGGYNSGTAAPTPPFPAGTNLSTVTVNTTASNNAAGLLVLNVPANVNGGSFTVSGVRVAVAGTTLTSLNASISATANAIVAGQTSVLVIASIAPGIGSVTTGLFGAGTAVPILNTAGSVVTGLSRINAISGTVVTQNINGASVQAMPVILVKEGFLNAFDDIATTNGGTGLRFTLSALPPPGVTVSFPASFTTDGAGAPTFQSYNSDRSLRAAAFNFTSSSSSASAFYRLTSTSDPTKLETAVVPVTITTDVSSLSLPLTSLTINFTTTLWPTGTAFDTDGSVFSFGSRVPRYQEQLIGPLPLVSIVASNTVLLVPFAQRLSTIGYDTGFAISNTTEDPTGTGFVSPTPQSGTMSFFFFPQLPSPSATNPANFSYTTSATSPGTGLDATGKLPAGSTYTVLLSQLLAAAGQPADFAGYVFIVTNFTNAHALFVVSNFTTFSQGALALVVTGDRNLPSGIAENLNF